MPLPHQDPPSSVLTSESSCLSMNSRTSCQDTRRWECLFAPNWIRGLFLSGTLPIFPCASYVHGHPPEVTVQWLVQTVHWDRAINAVNIEPSSTLERAKARWGAAPQGWVWRCRVARRTSKCNSSLFVWILVWHACAYMKQESTHHDFPKTLTTDRASLQGTPKHQDDPVGFHRRDSS